ncbi:MAG: ABC transporter permease, partial [Ferruginibacter sp.]
MIKNYLKIAWRNVIRNKTFSGINILGLFLGMAVFILIMLWVKNEKSYNAFHKDNDRIGLVMVNQTYANNEMATFPASPSLLAAAMKKDLPAVEYASTCSWGDVRLLTYGEKYFSEYGLYVGADFLKIFSFPLLKGNADKVLREPNTILISETLAKKYFGNEDPVGKMITVENSTPYRVEGVLKDLPDNSTIKFDFLMPVKDYINWAMGGNESWESNNMKTYVKLAAGVNRKQFDKSVEKFINNYAVEKNKTSLFIWDLKDWYLRFDFKNGKYAGGGKITYVNLFIIIGIFILLLACINFMNLSTARATQRAKEVGVRKVIGAGKRSLITQFISESVLLSAFAAVLAVVAVALVLPVFNSFLKQHISIDYSNTGNIIGFLAIILITGLLAGSYPAFILSSFKPVSVLKGTKDNSSSNIFWVRKTLVVTQFVVSILLIIGTIVVHQQISFIKNKNLGYNKEHLIWFPNTIANSFTGNAATEFKKVPGVIDVARSSMTFTSPNNRGTDVKWEGKKPGEEIFFSFITGDHNITQTMGIEMKSGRAFSADYGSDTANYILNEEAAKRMEFKDPVGQFIETPAGKGQIVGVTKDFHFESMHNPINPVIIQCRPDWTWLFYVRTDGKNTQQTIAGLEKIYKRIAPGYVFDYNFQDSEYERLFRSEMQIGKLVNWFAFFAIFISCLG